MLKLKKLKLKVLIDGDKGSKYFHDLLKKSHRDRSITCILDQHGQPTTSLTQVGALFVDYFKNLFGYARDRSACNADFFNNGPVLGLEHHTSLTAEVSNLEIKEALFNINDQKAPSPDGYSAAFFKKKLACNW